MISNSFASFKNRFIGWSLVIFPILLLIILFYNISVGNLGFMPTFEELENPNSNLATEVYTADSVILGTFFYNENRSKTEFSELSPYLPDALVSTEDERFYKHSGIDFRGLARVVVKTILGGDSSSGGGSTITQQLAKNLFPRENFSNPVQIVNRKLREWVIAIKLEKSYTKQEIIAMYFNQFDFLNLAVGIKSASKVYFNSNPNELKIEEAAMLVGMAKNPSFYNPLRRLDTTTHRRNVVLAQMMRNNKISQAQFDSLKNLPIKLQYQKVDHKLGSATYFREYLRLCMNNNKPDSENYYNQQSFIEDSVEWQTNPLFGWCKKNKKPDGTNYDIYRDGLRIYTTLNSKMQVYAEEAIKEHLMLNLQVAFDNEKAYQKTAPFSKDLTEEQVENILKVGMKRSERYRVLNNSKLSKDSIEQNFNTPAEMTVFSWAGEIDTVMTPMDSIRYYKHFLQSGFMSMDPKTGHVKAYVAGIDYRHFQYDHITQAKRQIGSTFKPFLYTLAMQNGYSPCELVPNTPVTITDPTTGVQWTPESGSRKEWDRKMVSLRFGLRHSLNNITAWLMSKFYPKAVIDIARLMGVTSEIPEVLSIALGVADLTLYEMVGAYSTYANKGVYTKPIFVSRIEDKNGNVLATFKAPNKEAISENTAYLMLGMLEGVYRDGTASWLWSDNHPYKIHAHIAAKTGTTQNQSDGWFMGITPKLVSGVWTGAEDRATHFDGIHLGQGANMALPIWALYMNKIYADSTLNITKEDDFEAPEGLNIDLDCIDIYDENNKDNFIDSQSEFFN
ncbi:MAG: transglycosylase domain-containing protein [Salinivirgaceae bacterium]|nr:transglycosylase domain-containing protein [Salinivirgaceae bacterium]